MVRPYRLGLLPKAPNCLGTALLFKVSRSNNYVELYRLVYCTSSALVSYDLLLGLANGWHVMRERA